MNSDIHFFILEHFPTNTHSFRVIYPFWDLENPEKVISNRFYIDDHTSYREEDTYMSNLELIHNNIVEQQTEEEIQNSFYNPYGQPLTLI